MKPVSLKQSEDKRKQGGDANMLDCEQGNRQEDVECTKQAGGNEVKTGRRVRVRGGARQSEQKK